MSDLHGVRIVLTRESGRAESWANTITERNGVPVLVPLVRTRAVQGSRRSAAMKALNELTSQKATVALGFASANAVDHWLSLKSELPEGLKISKVFAVGEATAKRAQELGDAVQVAEQADAVGLAEAIVSGCDAATQVVLPRAVGGRNEGVELLKQKGRRVHALDVYQTVPVRSPESSDTQPASWVISASPSAVRAYGWHRAAMMRIGVVVPNTHHAVIGSTTGQAALEVGVTVHAISKAPTIESILDTIGSAPPVRVEAV